MKKLAYLFLLVISFSFAQVGVGTTTPEAALDVSSTTTGFLPPRVVLTATNVALPVINPQGGTLAVGTMVYNTNTTSGTYGVSPGVYHWDGVKWVSLFHNSFSTVFTQTASINVTTNPNNYVNIPGLTNLNFVAPYDGKYQFVFQGYIGADDVDDISTDIRPVDDISGYAAIALAEGYFRMTVEGVDYDKYNYSISYYRSGSGFNGSGGTNYFNLFNEITIIVDVQITAGTTVNMNCAYSAEADDNLWTNTHIVGDITTNLGNPCQLNIMYIGQ
jgi:hypothetical protein